jgi:glucan phosphoethanolaminetransferase (alkaline phosphatase superfamily)
MSYISQFIITPYLGIWLMTAFSLTITIISRRNLARQVVPTALLIALLLIAGMVVAGIAIFSTYYSSWYSIGGSATRMLIFIIPLAAVVGIQVLYLGNQKNAQK